MIHGETMRGFERGGRYVTLESRARGLPSGLGGDGISRTKGPGEQERPGVGLGSWKVGRQAEGQAMKVAAEELEL